MTTAHASPARSSTSPRRSGFAGVIVRSWGSPLGFPVFGASSERTSRLLDGVAAELVAKRREHAEPVRVVLARREAREERRRHRRRGNGVRDALVDRPASFAGVVDV